MPDKKRIALITGASSGLGREFARLLAREAVDELWLVARREERLRELSAELAVPCRIFALDLTREVALEELSAALAAEPVVVRYLVNAAGFGRIGMAADIGAATTGRMIALNCRAAAELTERALPYMEKGVFCQAIFLIFIIEIPHRHRGKIPTFSRSCQEAGSTTASCRMRACSIR